MVTGLLPHPPALSTRPRPGEIKGAELDPKEEETGLAELRLGGNQDYWSFWKRTKVVCF